MNRVVAVVCCCLLVGAAVGVVSTTSESSFTVTIPNSIDTPEQTVTVDGSTYTVSSIARVNQGNTLHVETDGPPDETYRVYIHANDDGSQTTYDTKFVDTDEDGDLSWDTSNFDAGSYMVSIYHDGTYHDPQPLVIPAYETTLTGPDSISKAESAEFSVELSEVVSGKPVENVEVVVANDSSTERLDASKADESYVAGLPSNALTTGEYQVHAVVYSPEDAPRGGSEVIGISDPATLTIESGDQPTTTTSDESGGNNPSTSTTVTTATATPSTSSTTSTQPTDSTTIPTQSTTTSMNETAKTTGQPSTTDSVITPASTTPTDDTSSTNGVAGEFPLVLIALLAAIALLVRDGT